jgi:hypothetical protein
MLLIFLLIFTALNMLVFPILWGIYEGKNNAITITLGILSGLFWPICLPVMIGALIYCKVIKK